ncbi:hypothetical protein, partial [Pseudomonas aeruginosa]
MACISTRPSPGSPLADPAEVSVAELQARVVALEEERHKLQRINQALIGR